MNTALSVFSRFHFERLRPGENDKTFKFEGPGLVVICREADDGSSGFRPIDAVYANVDALNVAKKQLGQRGEDAGYLFAMLAPMPDPKQRTEVLNELEPLLRNS